MPHVLHTTLAHNSKSGKIPPALPPPPVPSGRMAAAAAAGSASAAADMPRTTASSQSAHVSNGGTRAAASLRAQHAFPTAPRGAARTAVPAEHRFIVHDESDEEEEVLAPLITGTGARASRKGGSVSALDNSSGEEDDRIGYDVVIEDEDDEDVSRDNRGQEWLASHIGLVRRRHPTPNKLVQETDDEAIAQSPARHTRARSVPRRAASAAAAAYTVAAADSDPDVSDAESSTRRRSGRRAARRSPDVEQSMLVDGIEFTAAASVCRSSRAAGVGGGRRVERVSENSASQFELASTLTQSTHRLSLTSQGELLMEDNDEADDEGEKQGSPKSGGGEQAKGSKAQAGAQSSRAALMPERSQDERTSIGGSSVWQWRCYALQALNSLHLPFFLAQTPTATCF